MSMSDASTSAARATDGRFHEISGAVRVARLRRGRRNGLKILGRKAICPLQPERSERRADNTMARITTEDCIDKISNRFELVMLSAFRARELSNGMEATVERENDKNAVVALREIAEETQGPEELRERLISDRQRHNEVDEPEDDNFALVGAGASEEFYSADIVDEPDDSMSEEEMLRQMIAKSRKSEVEGPLGS